MKIPIYQIDAFTSEVFSGNPAAVCILDAWLDDELLQAIAGENNLSETAYLVQQQDGNSALMLVAARLRRIVGMRWGTRRYLYMDLLRELKREEVAA